MERCQRRDCPQSTVSGTKHGGPYCAMITTVTVQAQFNGAGLAFAHEPHFRRWTMTAHASRMLVMALAGLLTLGGCSGYDDGYGYGGVSVGYGSGYYDYPRYGGYYGWYD